MRRQTLTVMLLPLFASAQLANFAERWKQNKDLKSASIGYCVMEAGTSSVIGEYNAHQMLIPASTLKVVTTSAALGLLGNTFRYETRLMYSGTLDQQTGLLTGNLVIVGSGDPTLQSEFFQHDSSRVTDAWAKALQQKGIRALRGRIVADASCFERTIPSNWIWGDIGNYFGAAPCGLSYADNKFSIVYNSGAAGSTASVSGISPNYLNTTLAVSSEVKAYGSEDEAYVYGDPYSYTRRVAGSIPPNRKNYSVDAALPDPALLCAEQLYLSLSRQGISCAATSVVATYTPAEVNGPLQLLYTHYSPTLDNIVLYTNLKSNNLYCESLLLTLGNGKRNAGLDAVKRYWEQRGLDVSELYMSDGSGLARANTASPYLFCQLLSKMYRDSLHYRVFNSSLPVAGKSGSMANIGKGTFIEQNLRAKTGYIHRARGYCGYLKTKSGKNLAFSILFNNYNCSAKEAKFELEKFMVALGDL